MRKGFTLIEMILVISIMSIIGGCSFVSLKYYNTVKNRVDAQYYCNAIVSFINNSKMYCRENSSSATVTFDIQRNEMKLEKGIKIVNKLTFENKIALYQITGRQSNGDIIIDNKGFSNDACTITLKDNNLVEHEITMRVGTGYVKINK